MKFKLQPYNKDGKNIFVINSDSVKSALQWCIHSVVLVGFGAQGSLRAQLAALSRRSTEHCGFSFAPLVLICKPESSQRNAERFLKKTAACTSNILLLLSDGIKEKTKQNTTKRCASPFHLV